MRKPWEIATWRFEQISPLLDASLSRNEKRQYLREKSAQSTSWPRSTAGRVARRPIGRATLRRWLRLYESKGLSGLLPKARERGTCDRSDLIAYALALLTEEPGRSLTQLLLYLELEFPDHKVSRSTLHRELTSHPAYAGIVKDRRKKRKLRDRYETAAPHESWQLDGKGPFDVKIGGRSQRTHVLSVIDDFSRFILAAVVAPGETTAATVRVTRLALQRYGVPGRMQFDRGSAFDSIDFRAGIASLGIHRNKPGDPEFQGKIEAYHRVLKRWFIHELRHQQVQSIEHLQELLDATIGLLYNRHRHREIKTPPEQALAGRVSARRVGIEELRRAFWGHITTKSHRKTGEVSLPNGVFRVPSRYAGRRAEFRYDHVDPDAVLVTARGEELELEVFEKKRAFAGESTAPPSGTGQLQKLLDRWRGRPNAAPQFGLPEVFRLIGGLLGHLPPRDEREARTIHEFYREFGPLHPEHFRTAIDTTHHDLGAGRSLESYLAHLTRLIRAHRPLEDQT